MKTSEKVGLVIAIIAAIIIFKPGSAAGRLKGDVNNDGKVDAADALLVSQHIIGAITLTGVDFQAADMNNDGMINTIDLLMLKQVYGG